MTPPHAERGAALVVTLMITALVAGLGGALLLVTSVETTIEAHHQRVHSVRQAADAGLACAVAGLRATPDWSQALAGAPPPVAPCLAPAALPPPWLGGEPIHPAALTALLQAATDARYGAIPDLPRWTLWVTGHAPTGDGTVVLAWIADDADDGDGDPGSDANGIVWVRAAAYGRGHARSIIEALIRRDLDAGLPAGVIGWRATR